MNNNSNITVPLTIIRENKGWVFKIEKLANFSLEW